MSEIPEEILIQLNPQQILFIQFILDNCQPGDDLQLRFTRQGPKWVLVRGNLRANPETCLHKVIANFCQDSRYWMICVSCDSTLSDEFVQEMGHWNYDPDHDVWVHQPGR